MGSWGNTHYKGLLLDKWFAFLWQLTLINAHAASSNWGQISCGWMSVSGRTRRNLFSYCSFCFAGVMKSMDESRWDSCQSYPMYVFRVLASFLFSVMFFCSFFFCTEGFATSYRRPSVTNRLLINRDRTHRFTNRLLINWERTHRFLQPSSESLFKDLPQNLNYDQPTKNGLKETVAFFSGGLGWKVLW